MEIPNQKPYIKTKKEKILFSDNLIRIRAIEREQNIPEYDRAIILRQEIFSSKDNEWKLRKSIKLKRKAINNLKAFLN